LAILVALIVVVAVALGAVVQTTTLVHAPAAVSTVIVTNTSLVTYIQTSSTTITTSQQQTTTADTTAMTTATIETPYVMNCVGSNLSFCQLKVTPSCQNGGCQAPCVGGDCYYSGSPYYCSTYACYYGQPYSYETRYSPSLCQTSSNSTVQCSGYLHQDQNGCMELAIPFLAPWLETQAYQYYTLTNLPMTYPPTGSWVTVSGQLQQDNLTSPIPYAPMCPINTIVVSSIS
jgi:hypothetical protein